MSPFDIYIKYLALKKHFTDKKYDYFKYSGKTRASIESFNKRKDRYFFEKTSRKLNDKEVVEFFVSNFITANDPSTIWIGELVNNGETNYKEWTKRQQSLTYLLKEQSEELFSNNKLEDVFNCSKGHPILLKKFMGGYLSIETLVIYDRIFQYGKNFDKNLLDPIWETVSLKIMKYNPFLNTDMFHCKKLLRSIINE
jgi:hypothetical protein